MMEEKIRQLRILLNKCYSKDLCYYKVRKNWNEDNKCLGMCAITALVLNDYLGGSIAKTYVDDISHYFNIIDGKIIDLTKDQFFKKIDYTIYKVVNRQDLLNDDTKKRYKVLKEKIEKYL